MPAGRSQGSVESGGSQPQLERRVHGVDLQVASRRRVRQGGELRQRFAAVFEERAEGGSHDVPEDLLANLSLAGEADVGRVRGEVHHVVGPDRDAETGDLRGTRDPEQVLQGEGIGADDAVEGLAGRHTVVREHGLGRGGEVGCHVEVRPIRGGAVPAVVPGVVLAGGGHRAVRELRKTEEAVERGERDGPLAHREHREGAPDAASPLQLGGTLGHHQVVALTVRPRERGEGVEQLRCRPQRGRRLADLLRSFEPGIFYGSDEQRRRGPLDGRERRVRVRARRLDRVAQRRDDRDGKPSVPGRDRPETLGERVDGGRELRARRREPASRDRRAARDVEVASQEGNVVHETGESSGEVRGGAVEGRLCLPEGVDGMREIS